MQIPPKSQKGALIRTWLVETVDRLIDCVTALRIRPGPGIAVKETPAGTIISLKEQSGQPRTSAPAAMVCAGIGMRIDNGTASSVYVPGATVSSVPVAGSTFSAALTAGPGIEIVNGSTVGCTVSGSGGGPTGIGYPDYCALAGVGTEMDPYGPEDTAPSSGSSAGHIGVGVTYLLPVHSGASVMYMTSYPECVDVARFAPERREDAAHTYHDLREGISWTTPAAGWVRISVLDNGAQPGGCLRFLVDGEDWTDALPLFRFGSYDAGGGGSPSGGGTVQYIHAQSPVDVSVPGEVTVPIPVQPDTHVVAAFQHDLTEHAGSGLLVYRYYFTETQSGRRTKHVTDLSDMDSYQSGCAYGAELHLVTPRTAAVVTVDVFPCSDVLISADAPMVEGDPYTIEPGRYMPLGSCRTFVFTFVPAESVWYFFGL